MTDVITCDAAGIPAVSAADVYPGNAQCDWPPVMAHLFAACGYATNLTPQVGMLLASCS